MADWLEVLRGRVAELGAGRVAADLSVSKATISLVINGKYGASTAAIEARVRAVYERAEGVACPELGTISASLCLETKKKARRIGNRAGSPATLRLYRRCLAGECEGI